MYTGIRAIYENFSSHFSQETIRVTKLKPVTHMDSGLMFFLYQNQGQEPITLGINPLIGFTVCHK